MHCFLNPILHFHYQWLYSWHEHIQEKTLIPEVPFLWQPGLRWQDQQNQDSGKEPEDDLVLLHEHPVYKRRRHVREGVWHGAAVALCQVTPCTESSFSS